MTYEQNNNVSEGVQKITTDYLSRAIMKTIGAGITAYGLIENNPTATAAGVTVYALMDLASGCMNLERATQTERRFEQLENRVNDSTETRRPLRVIDEKRPVRILPDQQ